MSSQSSPAQIAQFRGFYADLWRHYAAGQGELTLDVLCQAPLDYWQLVYNLGDARAVVGAVQQAIEAHPNGSGQLLADLENLFALEWFGHDGTNRQPVFHGEFFNKTIAPALSVQHKLPALLGFIRLNTLLRTMFALEQHLQDEHITPWCFQVVKSDVYRAALQRVGAFVSQQSINA